MPAIMGHAWREPLQHRASGVEIVKGNELHEFIVLPKRWVFERTLAWINRNRRLARDFERYTRTVAAFVRLAIIPIMLRCLAHSM
jgi:transposase